MCVVNFVECTIHSVIPNLKVDKKEETIEFIGKRKCDLPLKVIPYYYWQVNKIFMK